MIFITKTHVKLKPSFLTSMLTVYKLIKITLLSKSFYNIHPCLNQASLWQQFKQKNISFRNPTKTKPESSVSSESIQAERERTSGDFLNSENRLIDSVLEKHKQFYINRSCFVCHIYGCFFRSFPIILVFIKDSVHG